MLIDPNHRLLRPLWIRLLITALPFGWSVFEFAHGNLFWAIVFGAAGGMVFNALILNGPGR
ncbi:MAG: hypothetical protein ACK5LJ_17860 [Paracoccus sp. (in: a-proteobacteria)]